MNTMKVTLATYGDLIAAMLAAAAVLLTGCATPAQAIIPQEVGCHVRSQFIQADVLVTPFAVPVGVPVAPYAGVWYGASAVQPAPQAQAAQPTVPSDVAALFEEFLRWRAGRLEPKAQSPVAAETQADVGAILKAKCAACHSGADPQGGLRMWDDAGALLKLPRHTIDARISTADEKTRMPKGKPPLAPEEAKAIHDWAKLPREAVW